jgi:predicted RNA-binding protein with PUA-like domain
MKSEPSTFSISDLAAKPKQTEHWDGVRNYQARNIMRDQMQLGDQVFFYHSNCDVPGIVGIAEVVQEGYPDHTAFDPQCKYFDPKSDPAKPRWIMVDIKLVETFPRTVSLAELRTHPKLEAMVLLQKGSRLSVQPVTKQQWHYILRLAKTDC